MSGYVTLTATAGLPATAAAWQPAVGDACQALATRYLGARPSGSIGAGWFEIDPGSWAAGRHVVECNAGRYDNARTAIPVNGSLRPQAR